MKSIKTPQDNVEEFLYNSFNTTIYNDLTDVQKYYRLFDPLTFFNQLYSEFNFFLNNASDNYMAIKNHFQSYKYELRYSVQENVDPDFIGLMPIDKQTIYFLRIFSELIKNFCLSINSSDRDFYKVDTEIFQCSCDYISDLHHAYRSVFILDICNRYDPYEKFGFEEVKQKLKTILLTVDKIKYLIEITTEFKQEFGMLDFDNDNFLKKCNLEMEALKEISELEKTVTEPQNQTAEPQLKTLDWKGTDKEIKLTELVKALIESGVLETTRNPKNENELTQKETFKRMMLFFNIKEFNPTEIIRTIEKRKKVGTFLTDLIKSLNNWTNKKLKSE